MKPIAKIGIGPMSKEIISSVYAYSHTHQTPLMLIPSKNQIDYDSGYVFTTKQFRAFTDIQKKEYPNGKVYLCRDHCGPGFNKDNNLEYTYKTIDEDIECGFDLIHIDFCHVKGKHSEVLHETKKAIEHIQKKNSNTLIEIGTDENTGENLPDIQSIEIDMKFFTNICDPQFFVCQTGSLLKEINQVGTFHKEYVQKLKQLADTYNIAIKEHNADYLTAEEIQERSGLIGAINIAPQFGAIQTTLTIQKALSYGIDINPFIAKSYQSKKWGKWLNTSNADDKFLCSIIAGHYNFNTPEYKQLFDAINKHENFNLTIQEEMHKIFKLYLENFKEKSYSTITTEELMCRN